MAAMNPKIQSLEEETPNPETLILFLRSKPNQRSPHLGRGYRKAADNWQQEDGSPHEGVNDSHVLSWWPLTRHVKATA